MYNSPELRANGPHRPQRVGAEPDIAIKNNPEYGLVKTDALIIIKTDTTPPITRQPIVNQPKRGPGHRVKKLARAVVRRPREAPVEVEELGHPIYNPIEQRIEQEIKTPITPQEKEEFFWAIISQLEWKLASDGYPNLKLMRRVSGLSQVLRPIFRDVYLDKINLLLNVIGNDGLFVRNNIMTLREQVGIASHVVAMGKNQYEAILSDMEILQFFVASGECQSLDAHLPPDVQY